MPFCPSCGAAYRDTISECKSCRVALEETPPEEFTLPEELEEPETRVAPLIDEQTGWVTVGEAPGVRVRSLEEGLRRQGFEVVRLPSQGIPGVFTSLPHTGTENVLHRIAIPGDQFRARQAEVEALIAASSSTGEDLLAMREADEDYDVRGCPRCVLYFHQNYAICPGCGTELVPAVECLAPDEVEPDRVIVAHGSASAVKVQEDRFRASGFDAQSFEVEGWPVAVLDLPWGELTDRTADAQAILGSR